MTDGPTTIAPTPIAPPPSRLILAWPRLTIFLVIYAAWIVGLLRQMSQSRQTFPLLDFFCVFSIPVLGPFSPLLRGESFRLDAFASPVLQVPLICLALQFLPWGKQNTPMKIFKVLVWTIGLVIWYFAGLLSNITMGH